MSCVTCNCSIIAVLCKLNKDDLESNIIMNRLIHLRYIKIQINGNGVYIFCQIRIYFSWLISLGPHTIVIAYNPESTIPGASYGQCHTCLSVCQTLLCLTVKVDAHFWIFAMVLIWSLNRMHLIGNIISTAFHLGPVHRTQDLFEFDTSIPILSQHMHKISSCHGTHFLADAYASLESKYKY